MSGSMSDLHIVEARQVDHLGRTITLYSVVDSFHGEFWGWRVGNAHHAATYRHYIVALDAARAYIERQQGAA